jgi:hypothetical protein
MSVLGFFWHQDKVERRMIMGNKAYRNRTTRERIARVHARKHAQGKRQMEEEQHACMGGRPNIGRVRVLVMLCK